MTALEHAAQTIPATTRQAVTVRVANAAWQAYIAWKNRRAFYRLGELSDTQLADIGLRRSDLAVAVAHGMDPTAQLSRMARTRDLDIEAAARRVC